MKLIYFFILLCTMSLTAQTQTIEPLVHVTGKGIVKVTPDQVDIKVRVESEGKDAVAVKNENDASINTVIKFLRSQGLKDTDVQTEYINLNKNYDYNSKTYSYKANQSLTVRLKDINQYEAIISGLLNSGINRIDGVQFKSSKAATLRSEARVKAILDAKQRAETYAKAIGQSIGKAVQISEASANVPRPQLRNASFAMEASSDGGGETIAPGELSIVVSISASFELK